MDLRIFVHAGGRELVNEFVFAVYRQILLRSRQIEDEKPVTRNSGEVVAQTLIVMLLWPSR